MDKIKLVEESYLSKKKYPDFNVGDTVKVMTRIPEGDKIRLHPFEGIVIAKKGSGTKSSFTVRKVSVGEGVELKFFLHSAVIERIEVIRKGKINRAKLYYLRGKVGKRASKIESVEVKAK